MELLADAIEANSAPARPFLPCRTHRRTLPWQEMPFSELDPMLLVGLTGNIGSGKSTVAQLLSERGATIIDADVLARRAVEVGTAAYVSIVERWGTSILGADGSVDRGALRRIVFSEPQELEQLNAIVHPEVERMRGALVEQARQRGDRLVVCDIPLLFERRMTDDFDRIVLVDAPRPVRLERLVRERGLRETEAMAMIVAQIPAELKRARADFVIDNVGTLTQLDQRVSEVWSALLAAAEATETASV
jgi:dephospho-CoA kinase